MDDTHAQGTGNAGSPVNGIRRKRRPASIAWPCGCNNFTRNRVSYGARFYEQVTAEARDAPDAIDAEVEASTNTGLRMRVEASLRDGCEVNSGLVKPRLARA